MELTGSEVDSGEDGASLLWSVCSAAFGTSCIDGVICNAIQSGLVSCNSDRSHAISGWRPSHRERGI